jgi:hypothetical protein
VTMTHSGFSVLKYVKLAVVAFVVYYLLTQPEGAARLANRLLDGLTTVGGSLATFVSSIG